MPIIKEINSLHAEMIAWRHIIHNTRKQHSRKRVHLSLLQISFQEFGIEVCQGLAKTGVVGTITNGEGGSIGLRQDMDALDMEEQTEVDYASLIPGKMHACGHDGHTAMLLGTAKFLAQTKAFRGTVQLIFQPAEEMAGGGRVF